MIADIERASAPSASGGTRPLAALALQRRGFTAGSDTLLSDLMQRAGLANAADRLGIRNVGRASLEAILKARPDALVTDDLSRGATDQGTALLLHPALVRAVPPQRWITVPAVLTTCAGPSLPAVLRRLTEEAARISALPAR